MPGITITPAMLKFIAFNESEGGIPRLVAYKDSAQIWTIGLGRRFNRDGSPVKEGDVTTHEQAMKDFQFDVERHVKELIPFVTGDLDEGSQIALVDVAFQHGIPAVKDTKFLRHLNAGRIQEAIPEFEEFRNITIDGKLVRQESIVERRSRGTPLMVRDIENRIKAASKGSAQVTSALIQEVQQKQQTKQDRNRNAILFPNDTFGLE